MEISKKVIEIVSSISEWENLPEAERTRIVTDLFYPYMPGIQTLENIIKRMTFIPAESPVVPDVPRRGASGTQIELRLRWPSF